MAKLRIFNTLTNRRELFEAIREDERHVTFYSCGPTVYDYSHIGNFRSFLNADLLRRTLELIGYEVRHVMNMTDVGHMTDDETLDGGGEDKMAAAAARLRKARERGELPPDAKQLDPGDPTSIAAYYIDAFQQDGRALGLKVAIEASDDPSLMPRPTQYIEQMIRMIETLIERGHAYVAPDGVVYFDVQSFDRYGALSGNTPEKIRSGQGGRVKAENQASKKHPADFMLWKADPRHVMKWPSPWGEGYPGWHLECSVMAATLLGEEIDIHSGGEDNIFPHHECEIAQSCGSSGRDRFARYWFHTRHLMVEGEKMSKRLGNFFTARDLFEKGATPAAIRLALTCTHYRDNANFTMQTLRDMQRQLDRWSRVRDALVDRVGASTGARGADGPLRGSLERFTEALCDDLNISGALGALNEGINAIDRTDDVDAADELDALETMLRTLGVLDIRAQPEDADDAFKSKVQEKIQQRNEARAAKDWGRADAIRDELRTLGVEIKDSPEGTTWERVVQS